jgi:hypothetical protein
MSLASQNYKTNDQLIIEKKNNHETKEPRNKTKMIMKLRSQKWNTIQRPWNKGAIAKDKKRLKAKDPRMKNKQKLKNTKEPKGGSKEDWQT